MFFQLLTLISVWSTRTSWLSKVPCSFQESMASFATLSKVASQIIEFGTLIPGIGFCLYGIYYLRPTNKKANAKQWQPMNTKIVGFLYTSKVLTPMIVYTIINFKLPSYVPYKEMATKACSVTASLALYPPGRDGAVINGTYKALRTAYSSFLSNDANLVYPDMPSWEKNLISMNETEGGALKDDTSICKKYGASSNGTLEILNKFLNPPSCVTNFCSEGFDVAKRMGKSDRDALEFPLQTVGKQFFNLFAAIPMVYMGCLRPMKSVTKRKTPNADLSFEQLCQNFHNSTSYATMDPKYQPFVTEQEFHRYARAIGQRFDTETERQVACMVAADLVDPRTGFDAAAGYLCPALIDFQYQKLKRLTVKENDVNWQTAWREDYDENGEEIKSRIPESEMDEEFEPLQTLVTALALNPFSTAKEKGYFAGLEYQGMKVSWMHFGNIITNVLYDLNKVPWSSMGTGKEQGGDSSDQVLSGEGTDSDTDSWVVSQVRKLRIVRWTVDDARAFTQLGADAMETQLFKLYESALNVMDGIEKQVDSTLNEKIVPALIEQLENATLEAMKQIEDAKTQVEQQIQNAETTVQQLTDAGSNYLRQLAIEGSAQLQNSIRHGILNLTYDFEKGVFAEWNSDGTQRSDDKCTRASDGQYPKTDGECKSIQFSLDIEGTAYGPFNCAWVTLTSVCGMFLQPDIVQFRADIVAGEDWRSNEILRNGNDQLETVGTGGYETLVTMGAKNLDTMDTMGKSSVETMETMGKESVVTLGTNAQALHAMIKLEMGKMKQYVNKELTGNNKALYAMYMDMKINSFINMCKTSQLASEKTFEATNSAIRLVKYVIGTYIGFGVVSKLLPFALAIVAGVKKGVKGFTAMTSESKAFETEGDALSLKRFNALLLFVSGLVVAVPMITIAIFFYQAYAEQYFVLVVLAIEIWATGQAFKGFLSDRTNLVITVLSGALGVTGLICWMVYDENALFLGEYLVQIAGEYQWTPSVLKVVDIFVRFGFNFYFSQVITTQMLARLASSMFAHGATGPMFYRTISDDGVVKHIPSNLGALDVFSMTARAKAYNEYAATGGDRAKSDDDEDTKDDDIDENNSSNMKNHKKRRLSSRELMEQNSGQEKNPEIELTAISVKSGSASGEGGNITSFQNPNWKKLRQHVKVDNAFKSNGKKNADASQSNGKNNIRRLSKVMKSRRNSATNKIN